MATAGFWMLGAVAVLLVATGLPAFMVLLGVASVFAALGVIGGAFDAAWLGALPLRIVGLLENDLLQATPLYVFMGILLYRLPLADRFFQINLAVLSRTRAAPHIAAVILGGLLATKNGAVGASVAALSRIVLPKLLERRLSPEQSLAIVCVASTLGVVVPPSLVLILLGDAMMTAHTIAVHATGRDAQIINTQDVFRGAIGPAALFFALSLLICWWSGRGKTRNNGEPFPGMSRQTRGDWVLAIVTLAIVVALLAGVAIGYFYAVEAAALGGVVLFLYGVVTRGLRATTLLQVLSETIAVTGSLFALFVAATTITLLFRAFGTDQLLGQLIGRAPGGPAGAIVFVLLLLGLSAFVLDAFEIIFVIIPLVAPPLLTHVPDAVWVSALILLVLQTSFLIPPFGYAIMMARTAIGRPLNGGKLMTALMPFLGAQILVLAVTAAFPPLTRVLDIVSSGGQTAAPLSDDEVRARLERLIAPPDPDQ
jgi:tripartite ATP-independent transporter DctM subunit